MICFSMMINAQAQTPKLSPEQKAEKRVEKLKTALQLTDEQSNQLGAMQKEAITKARSIKMNTALSAEEKKAQIKALRSATKDKMKSVLNKDQIKKWHVYRKEHKAQRQARREKMHAKNLKVK